MKKQVRLSYDDALIVKFHLENEVKRLKNVVSEKSEFVELVHERISMLESIIDKI